MWHHASVPSNWHVWRVCRTSFGRRCWVALIYYSCFEINIATTGQTKVYKDDCGEMKLHLKGNFKRSYVCDEFDETRSPKLQTWTENWRYSTNKTWSRLPKWNHIFFENTPWEVYGSHRRKAKDGWYNATKATTSLTQHDTMPSGLQHTLHNDPTIKNLSLPSLLPKARSDAWWMTSPLGTPRGRYDEYSS
jgi:hypothetical protein